MSLLKQYTEEYGLPMSVYSDKHTTYKSTDKNKEALSQFGRALEELGIELCVLQNKFPTFATQIPYPLPGDFFKLVC